MGKNINILAAIKMDKIDATIKAEEKIKGILEEREKYVLERDEAKRVLIENLRKKWFNKTFLKNLTDDQLWTWEFSGSDWYFKLPSEYKTLVSSAACFAESQLKFCYSVVNMAEDAKDDFIWLTNEGHNYIR